MIVNTAIDGEFHILKVCGEVDASNALDLDNEIEGLVLKDIKKILVDCSEMTYISSAGLGVFMSKIQDFKKKGIHFALFNVSSNVESVFDILGLNDFIQISDTIHDAKEAINERTN